jgi:hypothetical protein
VVDITVLDGITVLVACCDNMEVAVELAVMTLLAVDMTTTGKESEERVLLMALEGVVAVLGDEVETIVVTAVVGLVVAITVAACDGGVMVRFIVIILDNERLVVALTVSVVSVAATGDEMVLLMVEVIVLEEE